MGAARQVGVSAEVQEGIFSNVHALTQGCGEALHRMLAFEKEHAVMRTKCTDDTVWLRYKAVLEDNQFHDLCKSMMQLNSDLLMVRTTKEHPGWLAWSHSRRRRHARAPLRQIGNIICNNLSHLRADIKEDRVATAMY